MVPSLPEFKQSLCNSLGYMVPHQGYPVWSQGLDSDPHRALSDSGYSRILCSHAAQKCIGNSWMAPDTLDEQCHQLSLPCAEGGALRQQITAELVIPGHIHPCFQII